MPAEKIPESKASYGKITKLGKGLSLSNTTISIQLDEGALVTLLFDNGSILGPTKDNQIVINPLPTNIQLTGVIIAGLSYLDGQWEVNSQYFTDSTFGLVLKGERLESDKIHSESGRLVLELTHKEAPTKRVFLHRTALEDFVDDLESPQTGSFELLLTSIADRDEVKLGIRVQDFFAGTSLEFGPIELVLDYDIKKSRLTGDIKILTVPVLSISMGMDQYSEFNPIDMPPAYRKMRILVWVSPISVDTEIFYEQYDFIKFKWKKKHKDRGALIQF